jgi:hypothetical protein
MLRKTKTTFEVISTCTYGKDINLKSAEKGSKRNPSTNRPIVCPLCAHDGRGKEFPGVWTYNMDQHFKQSHPTYTPSDGRLPRDFRRSIQISTEEQLLHIPKTSVVPVDHIEDGSPGKRKRGNSSTIGKKCAKR